MSNFEGCPHKSFTEQRGELSFLQATVGGGLGFAYTVECPGLEDNGMLSVTNERFELSRRAALNSLSIEMGSIVCKTCIFGDMSKLELAQYQKKLEQATKPDPVRLLALEELRDKYGYDTDDLE